MGISWRGYSRKGEFVGHVQGQKGPQWLRLSGVVGRVYQEMRSERQWDSATLSHAGLCKHWTLTLSEIAFCKFGVEE